MSAITGIFRRDGRDVDPAEIKKMNDKLSHRGPDGSRTWCEGSVALGHQMLHTTPESLHETLPFEDEESRLVITADARIDNREELAHKLGIQDSEYVSDSYFILKAYARWGEDCPDKLLGDFIFVIWDKNKETLFCARDHMGVKPFYYYLSDELFVFGTEIKALFGVSGVSKQINESQIAYFLEQIIKEDRETTFYDEILRLPAANSLEINNENLYFKEFWKLDIDYHVHLNSDKEYEKMFLDIFTEAVRCRLRSAYPVGSMLSGGLDSSSVSCIAQRILHKNGKNKLKTFSAIFDSVPESNERYFIEELQFFNDFDNCFINADKISPLDEIDNFLWYADNPFVIPNTFMNYNIYREASKNGVRIILDGFEGDDVVFHGDGFLTELFRTKRWKKFIVEIIGLRKIKSVPYKTLFLEISFNILPIFLKRYLISFFGYRKNGGSKYKIIKNDLAKKVNLMKSFDEINGKRMKIKSAHEKHYADVSSSLIQLGMELDWMSAPFSIEPRHPFFDKRLVEFCLAIPTEQKISYGWDRYIMRRAMSEILPKKIQWHKNKGDLSFNFDRGLLSERDQLEKLFKKKDYLEKYVDIKKIKEIYKEFKLNNTENSVYLWNALLLDIWLQNI